MVRRNLGLPHRLISKNFNCVIWDETGVFGKKTVDIAVDKFKSLVLSQSFLGKQMNFGTLVIVAEESSNSLHIENPEKLRQEILKLSAETK